MTNTLTAIAATLERFDRNLVRAVQTKLLTDNVTLLRHQPTGRGSQTVPVFAIPAHLIDRAKSFGLTVEARRDF